MRLQRKMTTMVVGRKKRIFWTRRWPLPGKRLQRRTKQCTAVVKNCHLDLNPNPTYPRESLESEESDVLREEEPEEPMDAGDSQKAVIADSVWRLYPTNVVLIFQPFPRVETGDQIP